MNVTKVLALLDSAVKEIEVVYDGAIAAGKKDPIQLNGLQSLGKANQAIEKAKDRLAAAIDKTTPKVKEAKAEKTVAAKK
jgi:hypothetical protein